MKYHAHKRPTMADIAQIVGVTKMTVSRYLRDPHTVAPLTGAKIAKAIEDLGYVVSRASEMLANDKSYAIGVLVPSLTNQVFADVIRGIELVLEQAGYQSMLAHYGYDLSKEEQRIERLLSYHVDALMLSQSTHSPRTLKLLEIADIPIVEMMHSESLGYPSVGFNNIAAARSMVNTMIARGCNHIVYFCARMDERSQMKFRGYQQAVKNAGLSTACITTEEHSSFSLGAQQLHQALDQYPRLDGIFCTNDDLAIGALFECQRLGIKVPQQIKIAGFHGHNMGQSMSPQLASVITPRLEIGKTAADMTLKLLNNQILLSNSINLGYQVHLGQTL